jgi:predicted transposase/invertase (TIGR01784 family)
MSDALEIHFIDMVKFGRRRDTDTRAAEGGEKRGSPLGDPLYRWLVYFDKDSPAGLVKEALTMDSAIQKVHEKAALVTRDKESMRIYEMREKALSDWTSGVNHARREGHAEGRLEGRREGHAEGRREGRLEGRAEGRQEGRAEGWQEGRQETARNLKAMGISIEQIAQGTGLTEQQIKDL